jgi:hypothetical protein
LEGLFLYSTILPYIFHVGLTMFLCHKCELGLLWCKLWRYRAKLLGVFLLLPHKDVSSFKECLASSRMVHDYKMRKSRRKIEKEYTITILIKLI